MTQCLDAHAVYALRWSVATESHKGVICVIFENFAFMCFVILWQTVWIDWNQRVIQG